MPRVLVYGGNGALGNAVVSHFKSKGWDTISVDFSQSSNAAHSVVIEGSSKEDVHKVIEGLKAKNIAALDALVCVAGGWQGGSIHEDDIFTKTERMWQFNVQSSIASSHVASKLLNEGGLLVLTGANAAITPTPSMISYGITKAATHHLIKSLAHEGGLPKKASVLGILPITLDTPSNRAAMPGANFDEWTPLDFVGTQVYEWAAHPNARPASGSLIVFKTANKITETFPAQ
uniref:Dihydropteridine reductase n=1 Tax=Physarum polycephalum TaxID=5791 RepID=Q8WTJ2_PHYPO|nr:dihydropteridine reductase [Physarum polycephalum]|eukprot:Phypoly_transcript_17368.p1 GENE.Phypoly_transcript_17368~~Phypoly_transcript_17368.p1  ORF type:complete len:232 (+),score=56.01 Phypoly_transcript_17368:99-794(+)